MGKLSSQRSAMVAVARALLVTAGAHMALGGQCGSIFPNTRYACTTTDCYPHSTTTSNADDCCLHCCTTYTDTDSWDWHGDGMCNCIHYNMAQAQSADGVYSGRCFAASN